MSEPTVWSTSIPFTQDGQPVRASVANAPIHVLADRTAALKAILDSIAAGQQLSLANAPLASGVAVGNVVYLDQATLTYKKAAAAWEDLLSVDGRLVPAESAMYTGIVTATYGNSTGDIVLTGFASLSNTALTNLFGTLTPDTGMYYLSMLTPGTVTTSPPSMLVRVLQYAGSGLVRVFQPSVEPLTHTHRAYLLPSADWLAAGLFDPDIVPPGATYGYDMTSAYSILVNLAEALMPATGEPSFVDDTAGVHLASSVIELDENGIWWYDVSPPAVDIQMMVTSADTRDVSLVHTVENLSPNHLTITNANGRVKLAVQPPEAVTDTPGHIVVKEVSDDNEQLLGPVVEAILGGAGITVTSTDPSGTGEQGVVSISLTEHNGMFLPAQLMNLNNAVTSVDEPYVFTLMPNNRTSSVTCCVQLPNFGSLNYTMKIWAQFLSPDALQAGPDITSAVVSPTPDAAGVTPVAQGALSLGSFPGTVTAGDIYLLTSSPDIDLTGFSKGTVFYTLSAASPSTPLRMVNTGIVLTIQ